MTEKKHFSITRPDGKEFHLIMKVIQGRKNYMLVQHIENLNKDIELVELPEGIEVLFEENIGDKKEREKLIQNGMTVELAEVMYPKRYRQIVRKRKNE